MPRSLASYFVSMVFDSASKHPHAKRYIETEKFVQNNWTAISPSLAVLFNEQPELLRQTRTTQQRLLTLLLRHSPQFFSKMVKQINPREQPASVFFRKHYIDIYVPTQGAPVKIWVQNDDETFFWLLCYFPNTFPSVSVFGPLRGKRLLPQQLLFDVFRRVHFPETFKPNDGVHCVFTHTFNDVPVHDPADNLYLRVCATMNLRDCAATLSPDSDVFRTLCKDLPISYADFLVLTGRKHNMLHRFVLRFTPKDVPDEFVWDNSEACLCPLRYRVQLFLFTSLWRLPSQFIALHETIRVFFVLERFFQWCSVEQVKLGHILRSFPQHDDMEPWQNAKLVMQNWIRRRSPGEPLAAPEIRRTLRKALKLFRIRPQQLTEGQVETFRFVQKREETCFFDECCLHRRLSETWTMVLSAYFTYPLFLAKTNRIAEIRKLRGGCIGNQTGSGKTLSTLLLCNSGPKEQEDPRPNLILVPDLFHRHWVSEIQKYTTVPVVTPEHDGENYPTKPFVLTIQETKQLHSTAWPLRRDPWIIMLSWPAFRSRWWKKFAWDYMHDQPRSFKRLIVEEAHTVSARVFDNILATPRDITWLITATPYQNTPKLLQMLAIPALEERLCHPRRVSSFHARACYWFPYFFRHCSLQTELKLQDVEVTTQVVSCPMTEQEQAFFSSIRQIIAGSHRVLRRDMFKLNRFFRILERIAGGGVVHAKLMLAILKNTFNPKRKHALQDCGIAPCVALGISHPEGSDCPVCYMGFEPDRVRQTNCRHVFCLDCMPTILDMRLRCPICRSNITAIYLPKWQRGSPVLAAVPPLKTNLSSRQFEVFLQGSSEASTDDYLQMQGKAQAFRQELETWCRTREPSDRLVIFIKHKMPAEEFARILRLFQVSFLAAGILNVDRKTSIANIECFRSDASIQALFLNTLYCTGFDLSCASQVWLLNTDLHTCKLEQSQGRVIRLSQTNPHVFVKVFVYPKTFGHFLWEMRHMGEIRYTKSNLLLFEFFLFRHDPLTTFGHVHTAVTRILKSDQYQVTSTPQSLVFNQRLKFIVQESYPYFTCNGRHYSLARLLNPAPGDQTLTRLRRLISVR